MKDDLVTHLELLGDDGAAQDASEISGTPIFTKVVRQHGQCKVTEDHKPFKQYALLGANLAKLPFVHGDSGPDTDPRVFYNISAPSSIFVCGSQGSGKSHTLSCLLENCLMESKVSELPSPLTGIVFHFDPFFSETGGRPCEASYLSSDPKIKVRVLCPPTNIKQLQRVYSGHSNVDIQELRISQADLNTQRMLDLMAASSIQGGGMPLYLHVVTRLLREQRITQQEAGTAFNYGAFKNALEAEDLNPGQRAPLEQRLNTLESFMANEHVVPGYTRRSKNNRFVVLGQTATKWEPQAGQLTIVDLSCPCITAESACALFNICLALFLEQSSDIGRVVALDEAHKYMTDSAECQTLTESLLQTIRLQRHLGARIIISTQEPTISPKLLDLCSVAIVHRFTSPDWLNSLKKHLAGASMLKVKEIRDKSDSPSCSVEDILCARMSEINTTDSLEELFAKIVALRTGEALLFSPSAIIDVVSEPETSRAANTEPRKELVRLGQGVITLRVRQRVTEDGGKSVMA